MKQRWLPRLCVGAELTEVQVQFVGKVESGKSGGERSNAGAEDKRRKGGEKERGRPLLVWL